jgi:pullulanase
MDAEGITAAEAAPKAAAMNNLAAAYYITAQGVPFIHAGEEMLRSKPDAAQEIGFNHNSYNAGDEINSIKWGKLADELVATSVDYYTGLIAFREAHPAMRLTSKSDVIASMTELETENLNVVAFLNNGAGIDDAIVSIFNADSEAHTVTLPEGKWSVQVNKTTAGTEALKIVEGTVEVESTSAMILVEAPADAVVTVPETEPATEPATEPVVEEVEEASASVGEIIAIVIIALAAIAAIGAAVVLEKKKK